MTNKTKTKTSRLYNILSASLSFLLMGGWAFLANSDHGLKTRFISGLAQGIASFVITLIMVRIVAFFFNHLPPNAYRRFLPSVFTVAITGTGLVIIHLSVGTPNIFVTVAPTQVVAFIFCLFTTAKLLRK